MTHRRRRRSSRSGRRRDVGTVDVVGFLAGCLGPTRESYRTDLRLFTVWLNDRQVRLLAVRRTHIELYGRWLEEQGRARSTVGRACRR